MDPASTHKQAEDYISILRTKYNSLWDENNQKIMCGSIDCDSFLSQNDPRQDPRMGYTLVIRPGVEVQNRICDFLDNLKRIEPKQHYYLNQELHFSVLSVEIASATTPILSHAELEKRCCVIDKIISEIPFFTMNVTGITCSSSCVLAQGFPENRNLELIRNRVLDALDSPQRYVPVIAHS